MPGQVRVGLKVGVEALAGRFPLQERRVLELTAGVLGGVVLQGLDWSQAQKLGLEAQKEYGAWVQRLLDATSADVLRAAPQHLSRLLGLLQACAEDFSAASGLMGQWLRKDRPRLLALHRKEIEQLRATLAASVDALDAPMGQVMQVRGKLPELFDHLMAASLACEWLAHGEPLDDEVRAVLADRALALARTAALVRQQQAQSMASAESLSALRDRIQDAVLIALPAWLAQLAHQPAELNDTQRFVARDALQQIIDRLKN